MNDPSVLVATSYTGKFKGLLKYRIFPPNILSHVTKNCDKTRNLKSIKGIQSPSQISNFKFGVDKAIDFKFSLWRNEVKCQRSSSKYMIKKERRVAIRNSNRKL